MRSNNLIPTPVTDKNGRQTTVHRRAQAPARSGGRLAAAKPSLGSPAPAEERMQVGFTAGRGARGEEITFAHDRFLHRTGHADAIQRRGMRGEVALTRSEVFQFLRLGVSPGEAAALVHTLGSVRKVLNDPAVKAALPGDLARINHWGRNVQTLDVSRSVDLMRDLGLAPQKVVKVLDHGLHDGLLERSVLEPNQLIDLFDRFKYSPSVHAEKGTAASNTMDAVLEGKVPFVLVQKDLKIKRPVITALIETLYPTTREQKKWLTEAERQELINDPDLTARITVVAAARNSYGDRIAATYRSCRDYGEEATSQYGPRLLTATTRDGQQLGVEGARLVRSITSDLARAVQSKGGYFHDYEHNMLVVVDPRRDRINVQAGDLVDAVRAGADTADIIRYIVEDRMDSRQMLAVAAGDTSAPLVGGWL